MRDNHTHGKFLRFCKFYLSHHFFAKVKQVNMKNTDHREYCITILLLIPPHDPTNLFQWCVDLYAPAYSLPTILSCCPGPLISSLFSSLLSSHHLLPISNIKVNHWKSAFQSPPSWRDLLEACIGFSVKGDTNDNNNQEKTGPPLCIHCLELGSGIWIEQLQPSIGPCLSRNH